MCMRMCIAQLHTYAWLDLKKSNSLYDLCYIEDLPMYSHDGYLQLRFCKFFRLSETFSVKFDMIILLRLSIEAYNIMHPGIEEA